MNKFLFELGAEEIPADMIVGGLEQLVAAIEKFLREKEVSWLEIRRYSSPRRLALLVEGLPDRQEDREELTLGPPVSVAIDAAGRLSQAAHGFARKQGVQAEDLETVETERGAYMAVRRTVPGKAIQELLSEALPGVVASLSWPKSMYWRETRFRFIRPLRWLVALWNATPVAFEFEGLQSGRTSRGHRFLGRASLEIQSPDEYVERLRQNFVLVDARERLEKISRELEEAAPAGTQILPDPQLLELVTYLNEYPTVLAGRFDPDFLEIPQEVLITVMRHHQKYFALTDADGRLRPSFLTVINTDQDRDGNIQRGHEKVLKARLDDAAFFWTNDRKTKLRDRVKRLELVLFQKELGSYMEKTKRIQAICASLDGSSDLDLAALLCKTDLTTDMVFEMSELQGVMGGLYARDEGLPEEVWKAIYEHYRPLSLEDESPATRNGALLSLADKLDTLVGCFGVGIIPTGSRDPFALRRQAQGLVRVLLDHRLATRLSELVDMALSNFPKISDGQATRLEVLEFLRQRIRFIFQEKGISFDVLNAVAAAGLENVPESFDRARALAAIKDDRDFEALAIAFKRIRNILQDQDIDSTPVQRADLTERAERALHDAVVELSPEFESALEASDYLGALKRMARLRGAVDQFFDDVMVLTEDRRLRANRLRLLGQISQLFLRIADISEIVKRDQSSAV